MIELGRTWYRVVWIEPSNGEFSDPDYWENVPIVIDVLARNIKQAEAVAKSAYMILQEAEELLITIAGTERQFQQQHEPKGEEDKDLLPY